MKIKIAVDATPIISALIGGISKSVLFDNRFKFITTNFTIEEVKKYVPTISKKSGVSEIKILEAISLLPVEGYERQSYDDSLKRAEKLIGHLTKKTWKF